MYFFLQIQEQQGSLSEEEEFTDLLFHPPLKSQNTSESSNKLKTTLTTSLAASYLS